MKKAILILLTAEFLAIQALAQTIVNSGSCGNKEGDCNWTLDDKGHLSITGSGQMKEYTYNRNDDAPWGKEVASIEISGITRIGSNAFRGSYNLTDIDIPSSVLSIGENIFVRTSLSNVTLHEGLKAIGAWAFAGTNLKNITLPESLTSLGRMAFRGASMTSIVLPDSLLNVGSSLSEAALADITTIYCSEAKAQQCADWLETATEYLGNDEYTPLKDLASLKTYENTGNGYYADGKFYKNLGDIGTPNYIKKRIYTIDEANKVSGRKNSIKIRYK